MKTSWPVLVLFVTVSITFAESIPPLAFLLAPAGEIMEGASGSFDPSGFRMTCDPEGQPLFVEEGSMQLEAVPFPGGLHSEGTWYPLGSGVNGEVEATAVSGSNTFVGGIFNQAGGNPAIGIARWNGSSWFALGSGMNGNVIAIAVSSSGVFAGGDFNYAGGNPASRIALWNGTFWSALGSGVNGDVMAIAVSGSDVYVGGSFTEAGGVSANCIAHWDGSSWSALGTGVNNHVSAIAVSGSDVYVGGHFTQAGGYSASRIARWVSGPTGIEPPIEGLAQVLHASPNPMTAGTNLSFQSTGLAPLTLSVYDTSGRLVRTQDLGTLPIGSQNHYWDGRDGNGTALASGVYSVRLSSEEFQASTRVVLVR